MRGKTMQNARALESANLTNETKEESFEALTALDLELIAGGCIVENNY
jgi:hypothetical protein